MSQPAADVAFWTFALVAVWSGYRVFRTDSMVRASFLLLASFVNVGAIMLLLAAEYLGFALLFMMTIEMVVMAVFMVMFMMNPAGLNPMQMVHQQRVATVAGVVLFAGLAAVAVGARFPSRPAPPQANRLADLGIQILGDSMLVMQGGAVALLAAMIGAVALSSHRNRYGTDDGSLPPPLEPGGDPLAQARRQAGLEEDGGSDGGHHDHHGGH